MSANDVCTTCCLLEFALDDGPYGLLSSEVLVLMYHHAKGVWLKEAMEEPALLEKEPARPAFL